jgi:hypothetical protein
MDFGNLANDGQSQATALAVCPIDPVKAVEDLLRLLIGNPGSAVLDFKQRKITLCDHPRRDRPSAGV